MDNAYAGNRRDVRAPGLAALAALIADETRAACLLALLDGRAWTAGELARHAGVAASTLSEHLGKLVAGGLVAEERQGRHRYVRLFDARVAQLVEELAAQVSPDPARGPRGLRASTAGSAMARGRTCYDHLAGRLGIALTDALVERRLLGPAPASAAAGGRTSAAAGARPVPGEPGAGFALTAAGVRWFEAGGIALDRATRRPLARACLDWTERRPHLAGAAGAALCRHALDAGWCVRIGSERAVKVTARGERALADLLGIQPATLR
ncbi:ArsR/SmtB family transcription factor [Streptomyces sp. NPDC058291]|uniref:ArsR/SmtB family transcription factor n=1 Tax=Streptomyces sp. NPDC058291 TaxID=3346427 RepID=UPI0036E7F24F